MVALAEVRDYIASLGIAQDENVYMGKLDSKKKQSIGVYNRKGDGRPVTAIGSINTYDMKRISLLVHWDKSPRLAEQKAYELFNLLRNAGSVRIGNCDARIQLMVPEPQDVGTDDAGIYEYVIWFDLIYSK